MPDPLRHKVLLDEDEMPTRWYNLLADLPTPPPPPLHPGTGQPVGPDDLAAIFPMDLIAQEVTTERYVDIPQEVQDVYRLWRPSPLYRAHRLEKALGTPARIYYKYEGVSPAGSHKPNTAVPQAYYNAKAGVRKLTTETGAGQWGTALAFACAQFDLECEVWQVRASYDAKPYRRIMIETFGGTVHPSPSDLTEAGRAILAGDPDSPGSLGVAISEAVEMAAQDPTANYALGSRAQPRPAAPDRHRRGGAAPAREDRRERRPHRRVHRWWLELRRAHLPVPARQARGRRRGPGDPRRRAGVVPLAHPGHLRLRLRRRRGPHADDEDAHARPRLHPRPDPRGRPAVPRDEPAHQPPLRGGAHRGHREDRRRTASRPGCCSPAPRASSRRRSRPTRSPRRSTRPSRCIETGEEKVILTALCGHGHLDLPAYDAYLRGDLVDHTWEDSELRESVARALTRLPAIPG